MLTAFSNFFRKVLKANLSSSFPLNVGHSKWGSLTPKGPGYPLFSVSWGPGASRLAPEIACFHQPSALNLHYRSNLSIHCTYHQLFIFPTTPYRSFYVPWLLRYSELNMSNFWCLSWTCPISLSDFVYGVKKMWAPHARHTIINAFQRYIASHIFS